MSSGWVGQNKKKKVVKGIIYDSSPCDQISRGERERERGKDKKEEEEGGRQYKVVGREVLWGLHVRER